MKKSKNILNSFNYAIQGFFSAFKTERNMKIHIFITLMVILLGFLLKISCIEWIIVVLLFGLVISGELINTAIEITVDIIMPRIDERAKKAKDIAASAVLVISISAAIIGGIIFIPKIMLII